MACHVVTRVMQALMIHGAPHCDWHMPAAAQWQGGVQL